MSDKIVVKDPVMLDKTGVELVRVGKSIAAALWAEKAAKVESKDVNFYDYDGEIVYSFTKAEFLNLTELPANPAHDGLTSQGWNWTLEAAKEYVQKYRCLNIGQNYTTDDGKTRLYVEIGYPEDLMINLRFHQSVDGGVTINWGDGSAEETSVETPPESGTLTGNVTMTHTYAAEGKYVVTMEVAEECTVRLGTNNKTGTTLLAVGGVAGFFSQGPKQGLKGRASLVGIEIGEGITEIGGGAFAYNTNLKLIAIPQNVQTIYNIAFFACFKLRAVVLPDGIAAVGALDFAYCHDMTVICLPASITSIGVTAFKADISLKRITIPDGVTAISASTFYNCHELAIIILPDTVTGKIGDYAFYSCYCLREINIPVGVTAIGNYAFANCGNLRKADLPEGLLTIGKQAFASCFGFKDFVIPSTVTKIDVFAFLYNDGTATFHVRATTPPVLEPTALTAVSSELVIYVPYSEDHSILNAYLEATGWSSKGDYIYEEAVE